MTFFVDLDNSGGGSTSNEVPLAIFDVELPENGWVMFALNVIAVSGADESAIWRIVGRARREADGNASLVGSPTDLVAPEKDAGAATWEAAVTVDGTHLQFTVTGEADKQIAWHVDGRITGNPVNL